jgi:hypothetical protein
MMMSMPVGWFFLGLAAVFVAARLQDYRRTGGATSPSR